MIKACGPIAKNESESRTFAQTCICLLPRLMSNELPVHDADQIAEETV
ncbi:MAG: hypothetical protein RLO80_01050 [Hyphomonas sp.]